MINNKKWMKIAAAAIALMVITSGCGNTEDNSANNAGNNNSNSEVTEPANNNNNNNAEDQNNDSPEGQSPDSDAEPEQPADTDGGTDDPADADEPAVPGEFSATAITDKLQAEIQMGTLITLDEQQIKDFYGLDPAAYTDSLFLPSMFNVSSVELAVVQLKSDDQFAEVKAGMEKRAKQIIKTFEQYLPQPLEMAKNYQIIRNGDFVLFSITENQAKAAEIFNSFFK